MLTLLALLAVSHSAPVDNHWDLDQWFADLGWWDALFYDHHTPSEPVQQERRSAPKTAAAKETTNTDTTGQGSSTSSRSNPARTVEVHKNGRSFLGLDALGK